MAGRFWLSCVVLAVIVGCGGQAAKPSNPVTAQPPVESTGKPTTAPGVTTDPKVAATSVTKSVVPATTSPAIPVETPEPPFHLEDGFSQLDYTDFEAFNAEANTWSPTAEGFQCAGKPLGYLYTKETYQNFTLRVDYRFTRPKSLKDDSAFKGNTGFLIYVTGEHKQWPVSLEVQGKHAQMAAIKENGGAQAVTATDDDAARLKARHAVGQWNSLEIVSKNGALSVSLNGTPISTCEPDFLSEGLVAVQSEGHPFEVRRMRIRRE
ncbi:MAG: DUF1080 domain-containing protein [Planctomycetes bacterium]|nr:DUF1080 domain-containing protein [Planctomycetota bacterium]